MDEGCRRYILYCIVRPIPKLYGCEMDLIDSISLV
jgi:hypothetical protein